MGDTTEVLVETGSEFPLLFEVDEEQLEQILREHARWTASRGAQGQRANLRWANLRGRVLAGADLRGVDLGGADLEGADLQQARLEALKLSSSSRARPVYEPTNLHGANLRGANLERADLRGANLSGANLQETNLEAARLWDTNLREADLRGAHGFFPAQLGGADTSHARLTEALLPLEARTNVLAASQTADKLFLSMLLGCAYATLTIASTTDAGLLGNSTSTRLPIVGTEISVVPFYWVAPLLLLGLYIYFHVYLQDVWEELASLPAYFPDGTPMHRKMYPWLLGHLPRAYWWRLRSEHTLLSDLKLLLSHGAAWCAVPLTLIMFWWKYLSRLHWLPRPWLPAPLEWIPLTSDGLLTVLQLLLITVAIWWGYYSNRLARATLRRDDRELERWAGAAEKRWRPRRSSWCAVGIAVVMGATSPLWMIGRKAELTRGQLNGIELQGASLQHADLAEAQLQGANLEKALLRRAYLGDARLQGANLVEAQLQEARMEGAQLQGAHLKGAQLQGAYLEDAQLGGAHLQEVSMANADLSGVDFTKCDLQKADLRQTRMEGCHLQRARLAGALLDGADLGESQLEEADFEAHPDDQIDAASLRNARLDNADLQGAHLEGVDLRGAYLPNADLRGADLERADLRGADLQQAEISQAQLDGAVVDATTKLTPPLRARQLRDGARRLQP